MTHIGFSSQPQHAGYDVVIIGGAIMGSSTAWFLSRNPDFNGRILVLERDPSYEYCSTSHTNSCIRQQFSTELNVRVSQFGAEFIKNFRTFMNDDPRVPDLSIHAFGYLYLANNERGADVLRNNARVHHAAGTPTVLLTAGEIKARYPFYNVDDVILGSINTRDEGYWDGATVFDWFRRQARENGVEYVADEVVDLTCDPSSGRVSSVVLASGAKIGCGYVVNASGPRAAQTAKMAGVDMPVEPRKRFTWIFKAEQPLDQELPLTIDPSGVHMREIGGGLYMTGGHADVDPSVDPTDFAMDHDLFENHIWPALATRVPQFESIRVQSEWAGHYAMNTFDHNAIVGPHPDIQNFLFQNGFSGHGLQQSPAMGRGISEWITYGEYRSMDLTPFQFDRIAKQKPIVENAVI